MAKHNEVNHAGISGIVPMLSGSGVPSNGLGNDGQLYFRTDGGSLLGTTFYRKIAGVWVSLTLV